jgi:hypothetical protein
MQKNNVKQNDMSPFPVDKKEMTIVNDVLWTISQKAPVSVLDSQVFHLNGRNTMLVLADLKRYMKHDISFIYAEQKKQATFHELSTAGSVSFHQQDGKAKMTGTSGDTKWLDVPTADHDIRTKRSNELWFPCSEQEIDALDDVTDLHYVNKGEGNDIATGKTGQSADLYIFEDDIKIIQRNEIGKDPSYHVIKYDDSIRSKPEWQDDDDFDLPEKMEKKRLIGVKDEADLVLRSTEFCACRASRYTVQIKKDETGQNWFITQCFYQVGKKYEEDYFITVEKVFAPELSSQQTRKD